MYIFPEMINMGLKEDQEFPSDAHKQVASTIGLGNPRVTRLDTLIDIVQAIISIPEDEIRTATLNDLLKFNCPQVW